MMVEDNLVNVPSVPSESPALLSCCSSVTRLPATGYLWASTWGSKIALGQVAALHGLLRVALHVESCCES